MAGIADGSDSGIKPITREEKFLAKAGGEDVGELKPITRREKFLAKIVDAVSGGASSGGSGGSSEWRKVAELKTEEDLTYISVTEDFDGNPISADELFVTVITTRESSATTVGYMCISPLPEWVGSFLGKGLYFEGLLPDAYLYPVLFKKVGGLVVEQLLSRQTLANNISNVTTWVEDFPGFLGILVNAGNGLTGVNGGVVNGNAIYNVDKGLKCFNDEGKLQGVTIGIDNANGVKIGAGTRIEVWAR